MRNMRKAAAVLLATGMVFALTACGGNKKVENTVNSIDDLEGKSIGVQLGTTGDIYASDYEGDKAGTKIERYNKGTDAVQALKQGKIDCVIIDSQPAEAFVEKNDDLQILDEPFADEEYAICISKDKHWILSQITISVMTQRARLHTNPQKILSIQMENW